MITDYLILQDYTADALTAKIKEYVEKGYEPFGALSVVMLAEGTSTQGSLLYSQVVVKVEDAQEATRDKTNRRADKEPR